MRNPEEKLESVLRESTRNLIQHLTAIHGYLQLLQGEEISGTARELVRKLIDHDQRACAMLETLIGLEQSQKNILSSASSPGPPQSRTEPARRQTIPETQTQGGRVLLVGNDSATLDFQRSVLFHLGGNIAQETNIENARNLLLNQEFELVLIDDNCLPGAQLEEFSAWIRARRPQLCERLIFLVSGASGTDFEKLAFRVLKKPLQLPELIQCSREFLPFAIATPQGTQGRVH